METELHIFGKKVLGYFKYVNRPITSSRIDITDRPTAENAAELVNALIDQFVTGEIDAVYVVYARFVSALSTPPTAHSSLPRSEARSSRRFLNGSAWTPVPPPLASSPKSSKRGGSDLWACTRSEHYFSSSTGAFNTWPHARGFACLPRKWKCCTRR